MNKAEIIFDAITGVRPGLIEEALDHRFRRTNWSRYVKSAACLALVVVLGFAALRTGVLGSTGADNTASDMNSGANDCSPPEVPTETAPADSESSVSSGTVYGEEVQDTESKSEEAVGIPGDSVSRFTATVLEVHEGYLLVEPAEGESIRSSADRIQVSLTELGELWDIQVGERIAVTWAGMILESYPAQLSQVLEITPAE